MKNSQEKFDDLMTGYLSGSLSGKEEQELSGILRSDDSYKQKYREAADAHAHSFIPFFESSKKTCYKALIKQLDIGKDNPVIPIWNVIRRVAAITLIILLTGISSYYIYKDRKNSGRDALQCRMVVAYGSQSKMILPDGTSVWLNSGSILTYNQSFGSNNRNVSLEGEAYFEVEKDKNIPFTVQLNDIHIKVTGTTFNVKAYLEDPTIKVDLIEGAVDVGTSAGNAQFSLEPNENLTFDRATGQVSVSRAETARAAFWTTGKLTFVNSSFEDIARELERRYDVRIESESEKLKSEKFSGSINLNLNIMEVLEYLDADKQYSREQSGNVIIIK